MPMPFKPSTMTQGSGLSNSLAAFNGGGANWNNAAKGADKINTARDSSSYIQRRKINAIGKSMNGVGLGPGENVSFKSSNSSWYTAYNAVRNARRIGTAKQAVATRFTSPPAETFEIAPTRNCEGVAETISRVENWISNGIDSHSNFKSANNNQNRKLHAYKLVNRHNKATIGIDTVRECEPCVGLPPDYDVIARKAVKTDVVDFASRHTTPIAPVSKADPVHSSCTGEIINWNDHKNTLT
jgi:hypothetical protein